MQRIKLTYILPILALFVVACNQTKYVPDDKYLVKKNKIIIKGDNKVDKEDIGSIVRQPANYQRLWIKWKLNAYNTFDSTKIADKRTRKNKEIRVENQERLEKQYEINKKRILKAKEKGRTYYTHKTVQLKDTVNPNKFFREWYKYEIGEPPVIFDSSAYEKTLEQMNAYLKQKGYYYGKAEGLVKYKGNKKAVVTYVLTTGKQYKIKSTKVDCENEEVRDAYLSYVRTRHDPPLVGKPFDSEMLDNYRSRVAKYMRDSSFYGFSFNHITYLADTVRKDMSVNLTIVIGDRTVRAPGAKDSLIQIQHEKFVVDEVFFHISDTLSYEGNFAKMMRTKGLSLYDGSFVNTIDTFVYVKERGNKEIENREAVFLFNSEPFVKPNVLESQNFMEKGSRYSGKNAEDSYAALLRMDLFQAIKTEIVEMPGTNRLQIHYYVAPKKRQSYSFQPRATNNNGYLGASVSISYTNRNLFRGGERLTISLSGGFESQPAIFDESQGDQVVTTGRSFNTFEISPNVRLTLPGLFPLRSSDISKRRRPSTIISTGYSYQNREDFERRSFQLDYEWKFIVSKTSLFEVGLPGVSVIRFVNIDKSEEFQERLDDLGDLFLLNAFSNQFIWQDWRVRYEYNIKGKSNRRGNSQLYFASVFEPAGNVLSVFRPFQDTTSLGQYGINGVGYSQFVRLDNELIFSKPLGKERSVNFKLEAGAGMPYGNTTTALPFDYSFFGGGANDNRGWRARTLGPGGYKYYLDTLRSATQIGDMRLGTFGEFRFAINSFFKGAVFMDAGNIWTTSEDPNRPNGQISGDWWRQIAVAAGVGLRMDLEYFIIRLDLGIPIRNPALPAGENWITQKKDLFEDEAEAKFGANWRDVTPLLYIPNIHLGIGYPF
ncbi:MAG: BamA/TamA family outer membrane protein [Crocinitomicaceae bacterium]